MIIRIIILLIYNPIKWNCNCSDSYSYDVRINHRGFYTAMFRQFLNSGLFDSDVCSAVAHSKTVITTT